MDLTSLKFLFLFFPLFLCLYLIAKPSLRLSLILVANIIFIVAGQASALFPLIGISFVGYSFGKWIDSNREKKRVVSILLWSGVAINLVLLAIFKVAATYGIYPDFVSSFRQNG